MTAELDLTEYLEALRDRHQCTSYRAYLLPDPDGDELVLVPDSPHLPAGRLQLRSVKDIEAEYSVPVEYTPAEGFPLKEE